MAAEKNRQKASILLTSTNTRYLTQNCLETIKKFTCYPHEIVVWDNNSKDGSLDFLKECEARDELTLIAKRKISRHADALDKMASETKDDYFVTMDSDIELLKKNWLSKMMSFMVSKKCVLVGAEYRHAFIEYGNTFIFPRIPPWLAVFDTRKFLDLKESFNDKNLKRGVDFNDMADLAIDDSQKPKLQKWLSKRNIEDKKITFAYYDVMAKIFAKIKQRKEHFHIMEQDFLSYFIHYGNLTFAKMRKEEGKSSEIDQWRLNKLNEIKRKYLKRLK